jgi:hypothetical protein
MVVYTVTCCKSVLSRVYFPTFIISQACMIRPSCPGLVFISTSITSDYIAIYQGAPMLPKHIVGYICEMCTTSCTTNLLLQIHKCTFCKKCNTKFSTYQKYSAHKCVRHQMDSSIENICCITAFLIHVYAWFDWEPVITNDKALKKQFPSPRIFCISSGLEKFTGCLLVLDKELSFCERQPYMWTVQEVIHY